MSNAVILADGAYAYWQTIGMADIAVLDITESGTPTVVRHLAEDL